MEMVRTIGAHFECHSNAFLNQFLFAMQNTPPPRIITSSLCNMIEPDATDVVIRRRSASAEFIITNRVGRVGKGVGHIDLV